MDVFNIICGVCSVAGLLVSVFTASKVIRISKTFNCDNKNENSKVINGVKGNIISGSYTGRDHIDGTRDSE